MWKMESAREAFALLKGRFEQHQERVDRFGFSCKFVVSGTKHTSSWLVDLKTKGADPVQLLLEGPVAEEDTPADCTIIMDERHLLDIATNRLDFDMDFMTGKLKVSGNMGIIQRLRGLYIEWVRA